MRRKVAKKQKKYIIYLSLLYLFQTCCFNYVIYIIIILNHCKATFKIKQFYLLKQSNILQLEFAKSNEECKNKYSKTKFKYQSLVPNYKI